MSKITNKEEDESFLFIKKTEEFSKRHREKRRDKQRKAKRKAKRQKEAVENFSK